MSGDSVEEIQSSWYWCTSEWCEKNDMVISIPKRVSMVKSSKQKLAHASKSGNEVSLKIKLEENEITSVTKTKILGVHVDNVLSWNHHVKHVCSKIANNLYLLKQIKTFLPIDARKLFYNSYVLPHFDYCCPIWGNCSQTLLQDLIKLQKRAARIILDKDYTTSSKNSVHWIGMDASSRQNNIFQSSSGFQVCKWFVQPGLWRFIWISTSFT